MLHYIGSHGNLVNLIGACTTEVRGRKLHIVVEYCRYGSILSYLRVNRHNLRNEFQQTPDLGSGYICTIEDPLRVKDLIQRTFETARGMEYIASKNIIHCDVAARNVLLSPNKTSKIADFGLSKKNYLCPTYTKHSQEPLAWKWAAIESLTDIEMIMKFSCSDVRSFGLTA
ncbi:platelet-derived growth factor receptor alpha-like [Folsomia candida]|uniref:platelet-derived growth factor receptor alpha-like n=1 Tax=Folsomia candida TaxID=158441 RepID=UPI001604E4A2|nr:platelet-derived growth factor receptor alpha-like [Folsomia candida]